jgi:crotonobetainyl-CoA:carnitine CoA-transferase CaiB-like acyl-CoA transferase
VNRIIVLMRMQATSRLLLPARLQHIHTARHSLRDAIHGEVMTMPTEALRSILPVAGLSAGRADDVAFAGGTDPILPTPFRIGVAGAATLAATGLAASDLWELRTGRDQSVAVDVRQATASLRSGHYMKLGDGEVSTRRNSIMGVYPARNGRWSYLHCNFPNHRAAALSVLGVAEDRDAVARAVATWDALDLEEAIIAAKGAGGMVRTKEEWSHHPQAVAIAGLPVFEIVRIGDSPPEPLPAGSRPLSGIRVLDLTRVLAGPTCARTLAEHGADVMKITAPHLPNLGYQEFDTGHGKLSAHLDLREQRDVDILRGLVREADVFSQGYRPGTLGSRGLSPEELASIRPGLVYVSLCAFSHAGPWASRRGFDTVVQTVSGITSRQAEVVPGKAPGPQFYPVSAIDYCTGYLMAFGAMVALARRAREGGSWLVRISLAQVGRWIVDLGEVAESAARDAPAEFTPDELERWSTVTETPAGALRHLRPTVQLSQTPPFWARPSVPLGYHQPVWPPRSM